MQIMAHNEGISSNIFKGNSATAEHFISVQAPEHLSFKEQVAFVVASYRDTQAQLGLAPETAVFRRIFLSDVLNQASFIRESELLDDMVAISIIQQPPLQGSKVALLAYHIKAPEPLIKRRISPKHLLVEKNGQRHLWSTRLCTCDHETSNSSEKQTKAIFDDLSAVLAEHKSNLADHCVRTWIYMKDVDVFYKGMVDSRRDIFTKHGLTADTHYIASTGIQGACSHRFDLVSMDAYSNLDLVPGQISYLNDFDYLCPTKDYNVTFERGTTVSYNDRRHHYISGTASIDRQGDVVHPGDVLLQLDRALENTDVLLKSGAASLDDMMYLLVYLRDIADFQCVNQVLRERFPNLPIFIVQGAVCRPAWLIEIEGVAITKNDNPSLPSF
jgi:enamine deaminase RidA (YjgF/YER057c/UK114 family)